MLRYNPLQYKVLQCEPVPGKEDKDFMKHARTPLFSLVRLTAVALSMHLSVAIADDFSEIADLMRAGRLSEALSRTDQALSQRPKDAQLRFFKGVIQRDSGKANDAITTFTRMGDDFPDMPEPFNNLAVVYASLGQYDKARVALESALRTNPSYAIAHENLADIYSKLASQAYSRALQVDTNSAPPPKLALIRELSAPSANKLQFAASALPMAPAQAAPVPPAPTLAAAPVAPPPAPVKPAPVAVVAAPVKVAPAPVVAAATVKPAPAAPVAPAVTAAAPSKAAATASRDIEAAVRAWASAWTARDMRSYLASYAKEFATPGGMGRSAWEDERRKRIAGKSNISVKLSNLNISSTGNKATVRFRQDYRANGLSVSSRKILELSKNGDRWLIVKESIGN